MKQGREYLEELIGKWYLHDSYAINENLAEIVFDFGEVTQTPESQLQVVEIKDEGKRKYLEDICKTSGKTLDDYLLIKGYCAFHGDYEVFKPNIMNARYDNIFCPKCIRHEQLIVDCTRYYRDIDNEKLKEKQKEEERKMNRRR